MNKPSDKEYSNHLVFDQLKRYSKFYQSLSYSVMQFVTMGVSGAIFNIDTYVLSSIQGTLNSIHEILLKGRINDAYALLRKYHDSVIINIYCNLYLDDNRNVINFTVKEIDNWIKGKEKIPSFEKMSEYIIKSPKTVEITKRIYENGVYRGSKVGKLRDQCNNHMHYLYYDNLLANDPSIALERIPMLDQFALDLRTLFILHFSYLFYLNNHYMSSGDYIESMDMGITPEEDSQYWVAPFIQEIFNEEIEIYRPDIAKVIKDNTAMHLE